MRHQHASNATAEANGQAPEAQPAETIAMALGGRKAGCGWTAHWPGASRPHT